MRVARHALALAAIMVLAACTHRSTPATPARMSAGTGALHNRTLQIYVDAAATDTAGNGRSRTGANYGNPLAGALRTQLLQRGFDVRAAETVSPDSGTSGATVVLARSLAAGDPLPPASRPLTYLHPNAPRLLLVACLLPRQSDPAGGNTPTVLAAYLANSADGALLWSNRVTTRKPLTDEQLRLLAEQLLATLPQPPN